MFIWYLISFFFLQHQKECLWICYKLDPKEDELRNKLNLISRWNSMKSRSLNKSWLISSCCRQNMSSLSKKKSKVMQLHLLWLSSFLKALLPKIMMVLSKYLHLIRKKSSSHSKIKSSKFDLSIEFKPIPNQNMPTKQMKWNERKCRKLLREYMSFNVVNIKLLREIMSSYVVYITVRVCKLIKVNLIFCFDHIFSIYCLTCSIIVVIIKA